MSTISPEVIEQRMGEIERLAAELLDTLQSEQQALVQRTLSDLDRITAEKARLCQQMDAACAALGPVPLRDQVAALPEDWRRRLEPRHDRLREMAAQTQKCNAVIGKIVHRSQQSVRELMHLMSGTDTDPLYSAQGQRAQGATLNGSPGTAIAKA